LIHADLGFEERYLNRILQMGWVAARNELTIGESLIFTTAEHLALDGLSIYNEAGVDHDADFGAHSLLLIGRHLTQHLRIKMQLIQSEPIEMG